MTKVTIETNLTQQQAQRAVANYEKTLHQGRSKIYFSTAKTFVRKAELSDLETFRHDVLQRLSIVDNTAYENYIKEN